jgi:hypothetical protein
MGEALTRLIQSDTVTIVIHTPSIQSLDLLVVANKTEGATGTADTSRQPR